MFENRILLVLETVGMTCNSYQVVMEAMVQRVGNKQSGKIKRSNKNNNGNPRKMLEEKLMRMGRQKFVVMESKPCK